MSVSFFFFRSVTKYSIPLTFGNTEKNDCRPMPFFNLSDLVWCIFYVGLCSYSSCAPSICVQTPAERERKWQHINECVTKTGQETESSGSYEDQKVLYWWADKIGINVVKTKLIDFNHPNYVKIQFVYILCLLTSPTGALDSPQILCSRIYEEIKSIPLLK